MTAAAAAPAVERDRMSYARELIEFSEGFRSRAYLCPRGRCTIGFGHTGPDVHLGMVISRETARQYLEHDIRLAADAVERLVHVPLTEKQYAACISLTYNIGVMRFQDSTLLFFLNQKKYLSAAEQFGRFTKSRINGEYETLPGLVTRRAAERKLFLDGVP